ncbi:hypothetical protein GYMLUDRAFT_45514 [Collybiopsis luxurians FD-317 M1]|uniref:Yeast cell wall synthesis Kre9/Knh1-like N-terminal domain-containing protein n=1 Tax=Collybiopsis luxurians FD-317 M1 TaxID=944289 RepID=A0A0D0CJ01_9AGAR|nr:hypothetical protein GYMLUDRAFT_45514 [Collybiopsis luxurians FD-317 M1]
MYLPSILATLALGASLVASLTLDTPAGNLVAGGSFDIDWQSRANDPTAFTLFLLDANNLPFGLEADFGEVQTSSGSVTVTLPDDLQTKSYVLRAVNSSNVDFVYASSAAFTITAA